MNIESVPNLSKPNRLWIFFVVAVVLAIGATLLSSNYLSKREADIARELKQKVSGGPTVKVLVSSRDLPRGAAVGETLMEREVLRDMVEDGTLTTADFDRVAGARLTRPLTAGYPINTSYFVEKSRTFSDAVEVGMRAITIEVDELNSLAQMVKPGNHVDLMLITPDKADPDGGTEVVMVLQSVKVLATGQTIAPKEATRSPNPLAPPIGQQTYSNWTFEVTPQNAAIIVLAQNTGKIRAVLRNLSDVEVVALKDVNSRSLLHVEKKYAEKRRISARQTEENLKAAKASTVTTARGVEYIIGGMGRGDSVSMRIPLAAGIPPAVEGAPQDINPANPSQGAIAIDKIQGAVAEALKRSGVALPVLNNSVIRDAQ